MKVGYIRVSKHEQNEALQCHLSVKIDRFSENLPRCQAPLEDELSRIIWRGIETLGILMRFIVLAHLVMKSAPFYVVQNHGSRYEWLPMDRRHFMRETVTISSSLISNE